MNAHPPNALMSQMVLTAVNLHLQETVPNLVRSALTELLPDLCRQALLELFSEDSDAPSKSSSDDFFSSPSGSFVTWLVAQLEPVVRESVRASCQEIWITAESLLSAPPQR